MSVWILFLGASLSGIDSSLKDTTDVVLSNFDVALISPPFAPGVLNKEVIITILCSISNCKNSMIKIFAAFISSDHSFCIVLEHCWFSINSYWDWPVSDCLLHRCNIFWNINKTMDLSYSLALNISATKIISFIWIIRFLIKRVFLNILERVIHFSSIASFIDWIFCTIYKLLLWEWIKFSSIYKLSTFNCSCNWKSPAWSTWTLIFYWGHSTFLSPIQRVGKIFLKWIKIGNFCIVRLFSFISSQSLPFSICVVSELVDSNLRCWVMWMSG